MNTIRMMDRIASVKRFSPKKVRLHFVYKLSVLDVRISIVPEIQSVILKKSLFRRRTRISNYHHIYPFWFITVIAVVVNSGLYLYPCRLISYVISVVSWS